MEITRRDALRLTALLSTLAVGSSLLTSCGSEDSDNGGASDLELASSDVDRSPGLTSAIPEAVASVAALAAGLYGALAEAPGNLVLSPYSVAVALAMTLNGAGGETATEMNEVLSAGELERFNGGLDALSLFIDSLAGSVTRRDGSEATLALDAANALFGQSDTTWERPFLDDLARHYGAGMRLVDYESATEDARTSINDWTAEQTHDRIPEIVPGGVLNALTRLVLVNAIYLKAPWEEPFSVDATETKAFHTDDGRTVDAATMAVSLTTSGYARGDTWEAVRLLYAGGNVAMTLVLPDAGAMDRVSASVAAGGLSDILAASEPLPVMLSLPRWEFRTQSPLKDVLIGLGMETAFDPDAADFSAMTREEELFVAAVLHEGFIAVDEEGTEAAAATAVVMGTTSMPQNQEVVVDRPFLFVIHDVEFGTPLFLGRVSDPTA